MKKTLTRTAASLLLIFGLSACAGDGTSVDAEAKDNLIFSSYAAADDLMQLAGGRLDPSAPVLVATVADLNALDKASPLGRLIAEQVASRLVNSGYTVVDATLRNGLLVKEEVGQLVLSRDALSISHAQGAQAVIAGTYTEAADRVYVNLRLIRAADGRVVAAHDYRITMDPDTRNLVAGKSGWARVR